MESEQHGHLEGNALRIRMLGPLLVERQGAPVALPPSRKVRAAFAYLALSPRPVTRGQMCELLWDAPNDPRGELRWCLTKLRRLLDESGRVRVRSHEDTLALDLGDCFVDAIEVARACERGVDTLGVERARALAALFAGDLLEGLDIGHSPSFGAWITGQRRRLRAYHVALLERLVMHAPDSDAFAHLERWLELEPFGRRAHELLLDALARGGRMVEAEAHVASASALFAAEGLDFAPLRDAWRSARSSRIVLRPAQESAAALDAPSGASGIVAATASHRASIAVMPFVDAALVASPRGGLADALVHDVITRLAKLRSLFVIAQGTVFALRDRGTGPEDAARMLDVDYVVSGAVRVSPDRLAVTVELSESRSAHVVWAEIFNEHPGDVFLLLEGIGDRIVASIASEIEAIERNRAILKPPNSLDAWEALHRGLWHMYRFTKADNGHAQQFLRRAVELDPAFARAYAGLSFTHWQNAFQGWADRALETRHASSAAEQALRADDRDPAAHWAVGRALWLRGDTRESVLALQQAVDLSPNFAQAHYTLAFVESQTGDPAAAISASDRSRQLSPFDPLLFAMLAARAMALVRLGRYDEAAHWAIKGAARPNAHAQVQAIAAFSLALAGSLDEARARAGAIRQIVPGYTVADFLRAFHFDADGEALFRRGARMIGMA